MNVSPSGGDGKPSEFSGILLKAAVGVNAVVAKKRSREYLNIAARIKTENDS